MIIAIEGGVGAGKTTLLDGLKSSLRDFEFAPEYFDIIPRNQHDFFLSLSEEDKFSRLLAIESKRNQSIQSKSTKNIILDRSFLTLLSYQYATNQFDLVSPHILSEEYLLHHMTLPDAVIHLDVDIETRKKRVQERGHDVFPLLLESNYNEQIKKFFELSTKKIHYLNVDTTKLSPEEILPRVLSFINSDIADIPGKEKKYSEIKSQIDKNHLGHTNSNAPGLVP